jgi:hypothetical protein
MSHPRRLAFTAAAVFSLLALAGCSGGATDGKAAAAPADQSVSDACSVVDDGMAELQSQISDPSTLASGDIEAITDLMDSMHSTFEDLSPKVTNADVSAVVTEMTDGLGTFSSSLEGVTDLNSLAGDENLTAAVEQIQNAGKDFAELCGG